jgi:glycosyltransferase involved in cell wall biosynthesis
MHVFIVCYNEAIMIPHTVSHYRSRFPDCKITIFDNFSSDNSVEIAKSLNCEVIPLDTENQMNEFILSNLRNTGWKSANDWVIVCDMDEWLCVNEFELKNEESMGTTILRVKGYNMIGNSKSENLSDIDLHKLSMGIFNPYECKNICFDARQIADIHFSLGAHHCSPVGRVQFSGKEYILKHMDELGFPYKCYKNKIRYERSEQMRTHHNMLRHYVNDDSILKATLDRLQNECSDIKELLDDYLFVL